MSSCLLPQNDDPLPELPLVKNQAPRIVIEQVKPQRFIEVRLGMNCTAPTAPSLLVEDPDVQDLIRVKWIVYESNGNKATVQVDDPAPIQGGTQPVRPRIDAPRKLFMEGSLLVTGTGRRLEVVIADGEFMTMGNEVSTVEQREPLPDGGSIPNPTYIDRYAWTVNTDTSTPCP